jgi:hypothetical protein
MSINFPNTPSLNQTYVFANITWAWNGSAWDRVSTSTGYLGATGPTGPAGVTGATGPMGSIGDYVISINGTTGTVNLVAGSNITITPSGNTFTISSLGGGGVTEIALNDLTDVVIVGATTNDILYYIGSTWINKPFNEILVDGGLF